MYHREAQIDPQVIRRKDIKLLASIIADEKGVLLLKNNLDLWVLIFRPLSKQKEVRMLAIFSAWFSESSPNRIRSSAKKICFKLGPFWDVLTHFHCPNVAAYLILWLNISIHKMKRYGDRGYPCLSPLSGEKGLSVSPFKIRDKLAEDIHKILIFVNLGLKLISSRKEQKKSHSMRS